MKTKPTLSFYTNIPTPYQQSFFHELSQVFTLNVIYYSITENGRQWKFDLNESYGVRALQDNFIARIFQKWIFDFHFSWEIFKITLRDTSENVIVGGSYVCPNATIALIVSRLRKKKVAYFSEPLFDVESRIKYRVKWLYLRLLNLTCNAIFCVGKRAAESFNAYQVRPKKFVIPYNINEKTFVDLDQHRLNVYQNRYKPNNEVIVLTSGALVHRKGMDILIKAMQKVVFSNMKLVIIGGGEDKGQLEALAGDDTRIVFAGFQQPDELRYFFGIADVFAFASRYDGWAVVINEAIAANVPIISSKNVGASVELITSDKLGLLCDSGDVDGFAAAIKSFLDYNKREIIKENTRKLIPLISSKFYAYRVYDIFTKELNTQAPATS